MQNEIWKYGLTDTGIFYTDTSINICSFDVVFFPTLSEWHH